MGIFTKKAINGIENNKNDSGDLFRKFIYVAILSALAYSLVKIDNASLKSFQIAGVKQQISFPQYSDPKVAHFKWKYKNKDYEIEETFFRSVYDYYKAQPKTYQYTGDLPSNWREDFYRNFFIENENDNTIIKLTDDIMAKGKSNNLTDDQVVELALKFVQSIPYDTEEAKNILNNGTDTNLEKNKYPYEVLYENKGVCDDKSILFAAILNKLGYGSSLFLYLADKHMAVGVRCPLVDSSYKSGFCYAETTATGHQIGSIPKIDENNQSVKEQLDFFNDKNPQPNAKQLSDAMIILKTDGKTYEGVSNNKSTAEKIRNLKNSISSDRVKLNATETEINTAQKTIEKLRSDMDKLKKAGKYSDYNNMIPQYNKTLIAYNDKVKNYNSDIKSFNGRIREYNKMINDLFS